MLARLANTWENVQASLWFVPALMVLGAIVLSSALLYVDSTLPSEVGSSVPWLFGGTAGAARTLLSTVAGSLITVISIAFSITIVAIQQAATQYSPRVLRNFTSDRGNQIVLGTYFATFTYSLLVMRDIREPAAGQTQFVPSIAITVAIALALVSIGMLIYFIDHITSTLQVSSILTSIRREVGEELDHLFPSSFGRESEDPPSMDALIEQVAPAQRGRETAVRSEQAGYLRSIDENQLALAVTGDARLVRVLPQIGDYVMHGSDLASVWSPRGLDEGRVAAVRKAFVLDVERTVHQDPLFGVRQIVDIGVKALSPGINDPTTAEQSLASLGEIVAQFVGREIPSSLRRTDQGGYFLFNRPDFPQYVDSSFSQIRRAARKDVHVTVYLLGIVEDLAGQVPTEERLEPLRWQAEEVLNALPSAGFSKDDQQAVREEARRVLNSMAEREKQLRRAA